MLVSNLMSDSVVSVSPEDTVSSASRLMERYNIGSTPVCAENGNIRGIVTDRDIVIRCLAAELDPCSTCVKDIMTKSVVQVSPSDNVQTAALKMAQSRIRRVPVSDNGRVVGMLSLGDIAKTQEYNMEASSAFSEISSNISRL